MKTFTVKTRFIFEGVFEVRAGNKAEAQKIVDEGCGFVMGGGIHTDYDEEVDNWDFPMHPEKIIVSVTKRKSE